MYSRILVGLDGSKDSEHASDASIDLAKAFRGRLVACHVYAAEMHRERFAQMEIGLPQRYQKPERLEHLRDTHDDIISGGMKMISDAYLAPFIAKASAKGLEVDAETPEGRNYVEFLKVLDRSGAALTVLGAEGQGKVQEATLGSFAERALLLAKGDILIVRDAWSLKGRPIIVGVDGSECSYSALQKAVTIASVSGSTVTAVAVYDPFFHSGVFNSISSALTKEQASRFNFAAQEKLHDEIIDDGLRALYDKRIAAGIEKIDTKGVKIDKQILTGKVFVQLANHARAASASLVVVGRHGVHREGPSIIGSNAHALARFCSVNLLVVDDVPRTSIHSPPVIARVSGIPAKPASSPAPSAVAGSAVEAAESPANPFSDVGQTEAQVVMLKKAKRFAPAFHEHIARARILGAEVETGTKFMIFDIVGTEPQGKVTVTEKTRLEFV